MITAVMHIYSTKMKTHRCSLEVLRLQLQVINFNTETAKQQLYNVYTSK